MLYFIVSVFDVVVVLFVGFVVLLLVVVVIIAVLEVAYRSTSISPFPSCTSMVSLQKGGAGALFCCGCVGGCVCCLCCEFG